MDPVGVLLSEAPMEGVTVNEADTLMDTVGEWLKLMEGVMEGVGTTEWDGFLPVAPPKSDTKALRLAAACAHVPSDCFCHVVSVAVPPSGTAANASAGTKPEPSAEAAEISKAMSWKPDGLKTSESVEIE